MTPGLYKGNMTNTSIQVPAKVETNYEKRIREVGLLPTPELIRRVEADHAEALSDALIMRAFRDMRNASKSDAQKKVST